MRRVAARRTDRSCRIFATPRRVPLTEMGYAIPREHAATAVRPVRDVASRYDAPTPLEADTLPAYPDWDAFAAVRSRLDPSPIPT
ncbi:D-arabinono-1,4-lactone oxidase [Mycobacterium simulans]